MDNDSHFQFDDVYVFSQSSQENSLSWKHTVTFIVWNIIETNESTLDAHSTEAFYICNAFLNIGITMIMSYYSVQTNEYDLQAIMCSYYLHIS